MRMTRHRTTTTTAVIAACLAAAATSAGSSPGSQSTVAVQGAKTKALSTAYCGNNLYLCSRRPYPRQTISPVDTRRAFRVRFPLVGRAEMSLWRRTTSGYVSRSRPVVIQCIDSLCVRELRFPVDFRQRNVPIPADANTLRVIVYGQGARGAEIVLERRSGTLNRAAR